MNKDAKILLLAKLDEKSLRERVLVPLLGRMGFQAVTLYHGPNERGKDIICLDYDRLGKREYMAVVAKASDLNGSVSSPDGLREVLHQIEQCFDTPYEDLFGMTRITMDRVWVITSRRIVPGAEGSIFSTLEKRNLSKLVRFISCESLIDLVDKYYPGYWDDSMEPADVLKEQRNRLSAFTRQLLLSLGTESQAVDSTISQIVNSQFPPTIAISPDRSLSRVGPYRIEVDTISEKYAHDFFSDQCGILRHQHFRAKESLYYAMFDVDEIVQHYDEVIGKTNPRELVAAFNKKLANSYPFWRSSIGNASDALGELRYLEDGLADIDHLFERLAKAGKLEWAITLVDSVRDFENELKSFIAETNKESFTLKWRVETRENQGALLWIHDEAGASTFTTEHKRQIEVLGFVKRNTRSITVKDITEKVQSEIRTHLEEILTKEGLPQYDD